MKEKIHPTYYPNAKIICACGNVMTCGSTQKEIHVELCSRCHPFYTGKQKLVDTARRVEKYKEKLEKKAALMKAKKAKSKTK
jgi:large subunit ribosomal protein L31